jgi:hypothetical protein
MANEIAASEMTRFVIMVPPIRFALRGRRSFGASVTHAGPVGEGRGTAGTARRNPAAAMLKKPSRMPYMPGPHVKASATAKSQEAGGRNGKLDLQAAASETQRHHRDLHLGPSIYCPALIAITPEIK